MNTIVIKENIVDKYGRVLLKKGYTVELDEYHIDKFKRLDILDKILQQTQEVDKMKEKEKLTYDNFKEVHKIIDIAKIEKSNSILQNILLLGRKASWYPHIEGLFNHSSWVYSHSINTALLSAIIASNLKYSEEKINEVVLGALLHDIGLVLVPVNIINKVSEHTEYEKTILRNHSELGEAMVRESAFPETIKNIILQHHERPDGKGYPLGLKDNEMSEEAQIVMVADLIDMSTSFSEYKMVGEAHNILRGIVLERDKYSKELVDSLIELYARCLD